MLPSSLTYCRPSRARAELDRIAVGVEQALVLGVAEEGVAVERYLGVEGLDPPSRRDDQGIDLGEQGVLLDPHAIQGQEGLGDALAHVDVHSGRADDLEGRARERPVQRVHVAADQLLWGAPCDLFDVHAAFDAEHHERLLGRAVQEHRGVVLAGDLGRPLHPQRVDGMAVDVHAEDRLRVRARLGLVRG